MPMRLALVIIPILASHLLTNENTWTCAAKAGDAKNPKRRKQASASRSGKTGRSSLACTKSNHEADECIADAKKSVLALLDFDTNQRGGGGTGRY